MLRILQPVSMLFFLHGLCLIGCEGFPGGPGDHGDIGEYVGTWSGSITFPSMGGGWPLDLTIESDASAYGEISMTVGSYPCDSDLEGEVWADREGWAFFAELQESGCTSSMLYLGGEIEGGDFAGLCGEDVQPSEDTDCVFYLD